LRKIPVGESTSCGHCSKEYLAALGKVAEDGALL
jgi:hypothetical protein